MEAKRLKNCVTMIDSLPKEIIFEIFSRLPIQSISQIRFVCKSWFDFINDPDFVNLHHSRIIRTDPNFLILSMPDFYLANLDEKHGCFLPKETSRSVNLICSVNGLVCLRYTHEFGYREIDTFHIWNPITKDVFKVPRSPSNDINDDDFYSENGVCGFALDSTTNRYKLVHSWYLSNYDNNEVESTEIGIYTLGIRNWKMIQHIPSSFRFFENASQVFLNGALHFRMKSDNPEYKNCIGVIDIASETFRAFEGLNDYTDSKNSNLYVVEDRLCLSVYTDHHKVTLWTMNDYGVTETWTARYTIYNCRLLSLFEYDIFNRYSDKVCLKILNTRRKGVVLFVTGDIKRYYDLEKKEFQNLEISGISERYTFREIGADVHLCSLISPRALAGARNKKTVPMLSRRSKIMLRSREKNRVK